MPEIDDVPVEQTPLGSISQGGFREIDPFEGDDEDFVVEGSLEASEVEAQEPAAASPNTSTEDIRAQLDALKAQMTQSQGVQGLQKTLEDTLKRVVSPQMPQYQQPMAPQETPDQRKQRLQMLYIQDPVKAAEEINRERDMGMVQMMVTGYQQLSKEVVLADQTAKVSYQKYQQEVEDEVQRMPMVEKAQNPRIYQTALERVKARHSEDILQEQIQSGVRAALQAMGLDPDKPVPTTSARGGPTVPSMAARPAGSPPSKPRTTTVIPKNIADEADRQGLSAKFYYQHLKATGRIK